MKAAVVEENRKVHCNEITTPEPGPGEVRIKVAYCGVCGSDIPRLVHEGAHFYPIVLGHEFSGEIDMVGNDVDQKLLGRKAACAPLMPNFSDPQCVKGNYSLGNGYDFIGSRRQGGFGQYVVMPQANAVLLPTEADLLSASFIEPLTVALHAINIMDFQPGRPAAVTGVGTIGLLMVQVLREMGAGAIAAFDIDESKLSTARQLGADFVYNSGKADILQDVNTDFPDGFATVFETAGAPPAEILALEIAGAKGKVMFVGTPHTPLTLTPKEFELINRKELTLQGSWMNYSAPFPGWEWQFGAELLANGRIATKELIDTVLPLSQASELPELLLTPGRLNGKIILDCNS